MKMPCAVANAARVEKKKALRSFIVAADPGECRIQSAGAKFLYPKRQPFTTSGDRSLPI